MLWVWTRQARLTYISSPISADKDNMRDNNQETGYSNDRYFDYLDISKSPSIPLAGSLLQLPQISHIPHWKINTLIHLHHRDSQNMTESPSVTLSQGKTIGVQLTDCPQPIDAFLGIPYAKPPIGDLRFRPAQKLPSSKDPIDASKYGPAAPGKALLPGGVTEQSEECLTVNIFRPSNAASDKLPVAIYVHGGAYNRGSAAMHKTGSMVAWSHEPFIAVSFGYRIGALGFLPSSLSQKEGVLNLGLKDQLFLFQWVQDNIEAFGGDRGCVTLFGLSAGAHSVCLGFNFIFLY